MIVGLISQNKCENLKRRSKRSLYEAISEVNLLRCAGA